MTRRTATGALGTLLMMMTPLPAPASTVVLRYDFDSRSGGYVHDQSGAGHDGYVTSTRGGTLTPTPHATGYALAFPPNCTGPTCPRAIIEPRHPEALNPGEAPFTFGAAVRLTPADVTPGANVFQKGYYAEQQWKLQVDDAHPSCRFKGTTGEAIVQSPVSIADGKWHTLRCQKQTSQVILYVDSTPTPRRATIGAIANPTPARIGGKNLSPDNDQLHATLDDAFFQYDH